MFCKSQGFINDQNNGGLMALHWYATLCVPNLYIHQRTVFLHTHIKITEVSFLQQQLNFSSNRNAYIFLWCYSPGPGAMFLKILYHTQLDTRKRSKSSRRVNSSSQRSLPTQHTTKKRYAHPYPKRDSNQRSQQSNESRTTAWSLGSVFVYVHVQGYS